MTRDHQPPLPLLCHIDQVPEGEARGQTCFGQQYIVIRECGLFYVYENSCPHLGVPLEWEPHQFKDAESDLIRCATHGALFLPETGECVAGPCVGAYLKSTAFELRDGYIYLLPD